MHFTITDFGPSLLLKGILAVHMIREAVKKFIAKFFTQLSGINQMVHIITLI
jgi:hypothetical protein